MEHNSQPNFIEVHNEFSETKYGHTLADKVRFGRYKPTDVSNERWVELLGADVNNLTHMPLTYGLIRTFISHLETMQPDYLNTEEVHTLQAAAITHDWAEAIVGDVSFGDKTEEQEQEERAAFKKHLAQFYTGDATELIDKARREVVFDHDGNTKLGEIFNATERIGYLRTALRASEHVLRQDALDCADGMRWLVADVLLQQVPTLLNYSNKFIPVESYLTNRQELISKSFELVDSNPEVFYNYAPDQQSTRHEQFNQAYEAWQSWIRSFDHE